MIDGGFAGSISQFIMFHCFEILANTCKYALRFTSAEVHSLTLLIQSPFFLTCASLEWLVAAFVCSFSVKRSR